MRNPNDTINNRRYEIIVYVCIFIVGFLAIAYYASASTEKKENFWSVFCVSGGSSLVGIGLTGALTAYFSLGALNEVKNNSEITLNQIKNIIEEIPTSRVSSITDTEKARLEGLSKISLYRYYKTWDGDEDKVVWRARKLISLELSSDKKRLLGKLEYKKDRNEYVYEIQISYIGEHLVFTTKECKNQECLS
jgi:hypothetical protein